MLPRAASFMLEGHSDLDEQGWAGNLESVEGCQQSTGKKWGLNSSKVVIKSMNFKSRAAERTRSEGTRFEPCGSAVPCYNYYSRSVKSSGSENQNPPSFHWFILGQGPPNNWIITSERQLNCGWRLGTTGQSGNLLSSPWHWRNYNMGFYPNHTT